MGHLFAGSISLAIGIAVAAYYGPLAAEPCQKYGEYRCFGHDFGLAIVTGAALPHLAAGIIFFGIGLSPARADAGHY